jgi:hypothetical protein
MLDVYYGDQIACSRCERAYRLGETIAVVHSMSLTFCYSDSEGGCLVHFDFEEARYHEVPYATVMLYRWRPSTTRLVSAIKWMREKWRAQWLKYGSQKKALFSTNVLDASESSPTRLTTDYHQVLRTEQKLYLN